MVFLSHRIGIAKQAIKEGYEVHLAAELSNSQKEIEKLGIKIYSIKIDRCSITLLGSIVSFFQILKIIYKIKPNLVHAITIKPVLFAGIALNLFKNSAFVASISGLGYLFITKKFSHKLLKLLVIFCYRFAFSNKLKKVIFQNKQDLNFISKNCKLNSKDIVLIKGSGIDLNSFKPKKVDSNEKIILFASRLLISKGIIEFYESALELRLRGYKFVIAGRSTKQIQME